MENTSHNKDNHQHDNKHPKPNEDAGAKIETVTPETEKKDTDHNTKPTATGTDPENQTDQKAKQEDKADD